MPRSNRPRGRRSTPAEEEALDVVRIRLGMKTSVVKRSGAWNVQTVGDASAQKSYICPGCGGEVPPGTAHVVAWRADGMMGEAADLADRRHWHQRCWSIHS